jgi:hypothetical protein
MDSKHSISNNSKTVSSTVTKNIWNLIETQLNTFDKTVLHSLVSHTVDTINGRVSRTSLNNINRHIVMTDKFYDMIRPLLIKKELVNMNTETKSLKTNKKEKKIKKADQIRMNNTVSKITTTVKNIILSYNMDNLQPLIGFRAPYIELIAVTYIYMIRFMIKYKSIYTKDYTKILSVMVSVQRFIDKCSNYKGIDPIVPSSTDVISIKCINDLKQAYDDINNIYPFNGLTVCEEAPELLVRAPLDEHIPCEKISPYDHQKAIIEKLHRHFDDGCFIIYKAMIGAGKTSTVVSFAKYAEYKNKVLIFVCNLETVRTQSAMSCYNMGIKFAIGSIHFDGNVKITNHFGCKNDNDRRVIICSPDVAKRILSESPDKNEYILFHDEPTIGADIKNSQALRDNTGVLMNMPKWTIFSSATSPDITEEHVIIRNAKNQYPTLVLETVYSPTVQIACDVRIHDGMSIVPFTGATTSSDLKTIIKKCNDVPFLGRMITTKVALSLWRNMSKLNISGLPNIPILFRDVSNMKADKIREIVLEMLSILSMKNEEIIKEICNVSTLEIKTENKEVLNNKSNDKNTSDEYVLNIDNIGTGEVWNGMTIIASIDPINTALQRFNSLLNELLINNIKSAQRIISKYNDDIKSWEVKKNNIIKSLKKSEDEKLRKEQELEDSRPDLQFPSWAHIGTREWVKKFVTKNNRIYIKNLRHGITTTCLDFNNMSVPDNILLLLFCGVGIYSPYNKSLCPTYKSTILEYASKGRLAYIVADNSISFGTNYPVSQIIVEKNFSDTYSIYTMFQLLGRAGRVGKSSTATAYVSNELANNIIEFTTNPDKYDIENKNICDMIELQEVERKQMIADKIASLQADIMANIDTDKKIEITFVNNGYNIETTSENIITDTKQTPTTVIPKTKTNWRTQEPEDWDNDSNNNDTLETKTNWKNYPKKRDNNRTTNYRDNNRTTNYRDNNRTTNYRDNNRTTNYRDNDRTTDYRNNDRTTDYRNNDRTTNYRNNDRTANYRNNVRNNYVVNNTKKTNKWWNTR